MNLIQAFENKNIRIAGTPEAPLFCAADVCAALDLYNSRDAVSSLDEDEVASVALTDTSSSSRDSITMQAVTESGLYHLIFKSRKPVAKKFRRWVTGEVLPALRTTGSYTSAASVPAAAAAAAVSRPPAMSVPDWHASLGLDVRTDTRKMCELSVCLSRAITLSRWHPTASQSRNEQFFQVIPTRILDLAESIYITGHAPERRRLAPPVVDVPAQQGGTIAHMRATGQLPPAPTFQKTTPNH